MKLSFFKKGIIIFSSAGGPYARFFTGNIPDEKLNSWSKVKNPLTLCKQKIYLAYLLTLPADVILTIPYLWQNKE
ncbi:hypothetical protein HY494_00220 [Candidatus Woesearchaeota archaeon]|nr:hypothetical protein [Candidatus Woesearchaeota archaeon]